MNYNSNLGLLKVWRIWAGQYFPGNYGLETDYTAQMSYIAHKYELQEAWVSSLRLWTKLLTLLDLHYINSKMNGLNHTIFPFSSALTFNDSNRKNRPYRYHVMQLKRNKTHSPHPFFPFLYFYSTISFPPHACYRKSYWKGDPLLDLHTLSEISVTMSCMGKIQT